MNHNYDSLCSYSIMEQSLGETPQQRVLAISNKASQISIDNTIPVRRYLRTLKEMSRMASEYDKEKDYYSAFVLYNKFLTLFIEKLPKHSQFKSLQQNDIENLKDLTKVCLTKAEVVKKTLIKIYEKEYAKKKVELIAKLKADEEAKRQEEKARQEQEEKVLELQRKAEAASNESERKSEEERLRRFKEKAERERLEKERQKQEEMKRQEFLTDPTPHFDRALKPVHISSNRGSHLKQIFVPGDLVDKFVSLSKECTKKGIEFCSFIGGKLSNNAFHATHLIIPSQEGTPDSCAAINEDEIWEAMSSKDLLQIGWIHTHPTQTAFLSSVDLHTTFPNQQMLAEYIAIVWSGKTENARYLALTSSGMNTVRQCTKAGFHEHPGSDPLFEDCQHIVVNNKLSVQIIDLS
ncbi:unnamed protein product [Dimorphilus gyrociliatus]|uniref:MPN domain-containing protein n=1 Tax=Dimorphilus gyrociliatus TaxID=2664684 RepID=A0A7I8W7U1_9ANNE|nr:unnamed protein product [Dimorphilus gyrociliatus]